MDQNLKTIFDFIQQNENLTADEKNTISKAVKNVDKELAITTFKLDRTEKAKRTTAILLEETIEELEQKRKAVEAQNRELEIEAALERIRAAALAMRDSSALGGIIYKLYGELTNLDAKLDRCFIMIVNPENQGITWWMAGQEGLLAENGFFVQMNQHASHLMYLDYCKKREKKWTYLFEGKEKRDWDRFGFSKTELARLPEPIKAFMAAAKQVHLSGSSDQFGSLVTGSFEPLPDEQQEIISRFSIAFNQAYIRFLDLQKAEAQARESQIQLALERVRARTMAMQKSEELAETVSILFKQLLGVGVEFSKLRTCGITTFHEAEPKGNVFMSDINGDIISDSFEFRFDEAPSYKKIYAAREKEEKFMVLHLTGDALIEHFTYVKKYSNVSNIIMEKFGKEIPEIFIHVMFFSKGYLFVISYEPISEHHETIKRFGSLFQQTYTRFLDLQKAEAQAREAHIEAALERVRSRSMGMQKSEELREIIQVIYEQFVHLDIHVDSAGFGTDYMESDDFNFWFADSYSTYPKKVHIPYFDHPQFNSLTEAKAKGVDFYANSLTFDEKNEFFDHVFKNSPPIPQEFKDALYSAPGYVSSHAILKNLVLYILNYTDVPFSDEENAILMRFGKAFEQAYTRFLDLQKAEAQAREAQIETALEKVRSRSLAMHKSDELQEVINSVYNRLNELDIKMDAVNIDIFQDSGREFDAWVASPGGNYSARIHIPDIGFGPSKALMDARENGDEFCVYKCSFEEKNKWFNFVFEHTDFRHVPDDRKRYILEGKFWNVAFAIFRNSAIQLNSYTLESFSERDISILQRFGKVFEQAYIRFLDLQKAEAQAREAQIEASLERLRSKTMAMHNSHDVGESVATMFDELERLDVKTKRCGVLIHSNPVNTEVWTARSNPDGKAALIIGRLDMTVHPLLSGARNSWLNKESSFSYELTGDDIINYFRAINDTKNYPHLFNIETLPSYEYHTDFHFRDGSIFAFTAEPIPAEALLIFNRFASVFGQTYRRYLDLKKAEAQAREAQIEAALERVRASTMAMHKSEQLAETAKVLFEQFDLLGKIPDRISIGIIKEEKQLIEWWVTNQNGSQLNYGFNASIAEPSMAKVFAAWKEKKESIVIDLTGKDLQDWIRFVREEVKMEIDETKMKGRRVHQGAFFSQGVLLFSTHQPVTNDVMQLLVRFARVFNQTYTRFLDLQKAETQAKEAIKASSLDRVRGEIASMRTINDLQRITPIIWHELTALGVPFVRCGVFIMNEVTEHVQVHLSAPDGRSLGLLDLPFNSSELTINSVNHWRKGIIFKTHWSKDEFLNFMKSMIDQGQIRNPETYQGAATPPESLHLHFIPFKQGMLYVGSSLPLEVDELQLVKSLAESFSIAYARYEDFRQLEEAKNQIEKTFTELKAAQSQLIQAEKMASLGELTAGIAHEIQNPLNFVNNFSEVSNELMDEMREELVEGSRQLAAGSRQSGEEKLKLANEIAEDIKQNLIKINHHGKRASDIVKGMLQHSRTSSGVKEPTDINALADEYLRLAYHGLRAKDKSFNAEFVTDFDEKLPKINVIPQDIGRVLLNLINNAFYAVDKKAKNMTPPPPVGGIENPQNKYEPIVTVTTGFSLSFGEGRGEVRITVKDNGPGIPLEIKDKIFQPFFTTKPTGQGTGLGLSLSYDIVKAHGGELKVDNKPGEGVVFSIILPIV